MVAKCLMAMQMEERQHQWLGAAQRVLWSRALVICRRRRPI